MIPVSSDFSLFLSWYSFLPHRENFPCQKIILPWDFPGGPGVENPPSSAGDMGSIPGGGTKIPHAAEQLSLCTTATEPAL